MKIKTLKLLACSALLTLGTLAAQDAMAQSADVPVTLTTSSAITVTPGATLDFGEWFIRPVDDDTVTLVLNPQTGAITDTENDVGSDGDDGTAVVDIGNTSAAGTVDVTTPATATVNVYATITDFIDPQLVISAPTFAVNAGASNPLSINSGAPSTFISTGGTADTIRVGATVTASDTAGVVPADNAHTGNIELTFSF